MASTTTLDIKDLLKTVSGVTANQRIELLSKDTISKDDMSELVSGTDFESNDIAKKLFSEILIGYETIVRDNNKRSHYIENISNLMKAASLQEKSQRIIEYLIGNKTFKRNFDTQFSSIDYPYIKEIFLAFYENTTNMTLRKELLNFWNKEMIGKMIAVSCDPHSKNVENYFFKEIIENNISEVNDGIVDILKNNNKAIYFYNLISTFQSEKSQQILTNCTRKLSDDEFKALISEIDATASLDLKDFIHILPQEILSRIINLNKETFNNTFVALSPEKKAIVISKISSEEQLKNILATLDKKQTDNLMKAFNKPTYEDVKTRIKKVNSNVEGIKKDYREIRKDIWGNRFAWIDKKRNQLSVRWFEWRVNGKEKNLIKLSELHTSEDRVGIIGCVQLFFYMREAEKYKQLNEELNKRRENIKKIDENIGKRIDDIIVKKEDIVQRKEFMREDAKIAKARIKNITNLKRVKEQLAKETPKKESKLGKLELSTDKQELAWSYLLSEASSISSVKEERIRQIITDNKEMLGNLTSEEIALLAKKIRVKIEAIKKSGKNVEEEVEELAGMRMGMSNYLVIIAVTALTIMGLIAILTLILS